MWYISFGGGAGGVNNILVYHDSGHPHARPHLLPTGKDDPPLQELRGFAILGSGFEDHTRTRVAHSVRGVLFHDGHLYVADEPADAVKVYAVETGRFCGQIAGDDLRAPVQLLLDAGAGMGPGVLYIGSSGNDRVVCYDLAQGAPAGTVAPRTFLHGKVKYVSGMAFDAAGIFY